MGGKPSKGTRADRRLAANRPSRSSKSKLPFPGAAPLFTKKGTKAARPKK